MADESKRLTRGEAIRAKCLDCCCGQSAEVRECTARECPLWPFRMGRESIAETCMMTKSKMRKITATCEQSDENDEIEEE